MAFTKRLACLIIAGLFASVLSPVGCNAPPPPPITSEGETIKVLAVSPTERTELQAATDLEAARVNYRYRLEVMNAYYDKVGNMDKLIWTRREIRNLDRVQTFKWEGLPHIELPSGESLETVDERVLVEYVVSARNTYLKNLEKLKDYYTQSDQSYKAQLITNMQDRFDPVWTYMYFLSAEIPPANLKGSSFIPEADVLFAEALRDHQIGKGILLALTTNYPKQRQALRKFLQLITKFPASNKIAQSAYYIGEIYKEYFNENIRAVHWYERAWQWDPNITKPARFQAATVHDIRLQEYSRAVDLYRQVIKHEQFNASNVNFSIRRIRQLTGL